VSCISPRLKANIIENKIIIKDSPRIITLIIDDFRVSPQINPQTNPVIAINTVSVYELIN
jgi:hypothetical protein